MSDQSYREELSAIRFPDSLPYPGIKAQFMRRRESTQGGAFSGSIFSGRTPEKMCEAPRRGSPRSSSRMRPLNANVPRHNRASLGGVIADNFTRSFSASLGIVVRSRSV